MRPTKTCSKCGWVLDFQDPTKKCPICGTKMPRACRICGSPNLYGDYALCAECRKATRTEPYVRRNITAVNRRNVYNEWCAKIARIPRTYPVLTETQWLEAVKHFNGCACCDNPSVDARGYFVPFKDGGRYCDWNIIPMCEKCATALRLNPNYWVHINKLITPEHLLSVVDYLEPKIEAAIGDNNE